jgi:hypothetical protein
MVRWIGRTVIRPECNVGRAGWREGRLKAKGGEVAGGKEGPAMLGWILADSAVQRPVGAEAPFAGNQDGSVAQGRGLGCQLVMGLAELVSE